MHFPNSFFCFSQVFVWIRSWISGPFILSFIAVATAYITKNGYSVAIIAAVNCIAQCKPSLTSARHGFESLFSIQQPNSKNSMERKRTTSDEEVVFMKLRVKRRVFSSKKPLFLSNISRRNNNWITLTRAMKESE